MLRRASPFSLISLVEFLLYDFLILVNKVKDLSAVVVETGNCINAVKNAEKSLNIWIKCTIAE